MRVYLQRNYLFNDKNLKAFIWNHEKELILWKAGKCESSR
ncbi:hypothetical protein MUGA111182_17800 [Mucilaginibacter galii]